MVLDEINYCAAMYIYAKRVPPKENAYSAYDRIYCAFTLACHFSEVLFLFAAEAYFTYLWEMLYSTSGAIAV